MRRINNNSATEETNGRQTQTSQSMRLRANESVAKKLKCEFQGCLESYDRSDRLKYHFLTHLSIRASGEKLFECDYKTCAKKLTQLVQIEAHKRIRTNERPFVCGFNNCGKRFKQSEPEKGSFK
jgi:uncharacterized Zn-finger protein